MALPAYAEAVRFYDMALQALGRKEPVDAVQRCTLLLALGEAQREAGEHVRALETLQSAAEAARQVGSVAALVHAALEYEHTVWIGGLPAEPAVHLLEEALRTLDRGASVLARQGPRQSGQGAAGHGRAGTGSGVCATGG